MTGRQIGEKLEEINTPTLSADFEPHPFPSRLDDTNVRGVCQLPVLDIFRAKAAVQDKPLICVGPHLICHLFCYSFFT